MAERESIDAAARARWQQVEALLDAALELPAHERAAFLRDACPGDASLRAEAAQILHAGEQQDVFSAIDFGDLAAALISEISPHFAAVPAPLPQRIGSYRIVRELGHGGMGTVYLAERAAGGFEQKVALKVVRRGLHHDVRTVRRFRDERQTLAALQHPQIARLLDGGVTEDGLPFFAMEFIDGAPIDRFCDDQQLPIEQRLELFVRVCDAAAHAHAQGIVHRDIKPSNILVAADGTPKLLDFGIAKLVQEGEGSGVTAMTRTGERLLTPEYASPEQVRGQPITAATDVYALGVLLFELLTGRHPFHRPGRTPHELERATLEEEPVRPSTIVTRNRTAAAESECLAVTRSITATRLKQRLRGDLDSIVLQALRKDPERRYADAGPLADDVRRHLAGLAVHARGDSVGYRARVWVRRHRRTVAAGVFGVVIGIATIAGVALRRGSTATEWDETRGLVESVSTRSAMARRYYEDGLRAFATGQLADATRLFRSALGEDSTFAMAAFYGATAAVHSEDYRTAGELLEHSMRQVRFVSDQERLIVLANYAARRRLPTLRTYADSLNTRFPGSALGLLWSARAAAMEGDWKRAIGDARRVLVIDSLSIRKNLLPCHACEASGQIIDAYLMMDSMQTAEREATAGVRLTPASAGAWRWLAYVHLLSGSPTDSAYRRAVELDPTDVDYAIEWNADFRMRRGEFAAADELLRARMHTAPPARVERSMGLLITSLRMQERWQDALELARGYRQLTVPDSGIVMAVHLAQVLWESGAARAGAALYDSIAQAPPPGAADPTAQRIWHLTHAADALAGAGDTSALAAVVDTIRALTARSVSRRDHAMAQHVAGLLLAARGDDAAAAGAFRDAITSWNRGYTRTNYELARALLRLRRPAEAVAALQPALRGSLEVSNTYLTHTALHRLLAQAWHAAGSADSAAVHEAWVRRAVAR